MNRTINWNEIFQLVLSATGETIYMVLLAGVFTLLIGLPLGVLLDRKSVPAATACIRCRA